MSEEISFKDLKKELKDVEKLNKEHLDIKSWASDIQLWIDLQKIKDPKKIYLGCVLTSSGEPRQIIQDLKDNKTEEEEVEDEQSDSESASETEEENYPSFEEIQDALETFYGLKEDQNMLLRELRALRIKKHEKVKEFNTRFRTIYLKLDKKRKKQVSVLDYADSLQPNVEAWKKISMKDDITLMKAFTIAEKVDRLTIKTQSSGYTPINYNNTQINYNKKVWNPNALTNTTKSNNFIKKENNGADKKNNLQKDIDDLTNKMKHLSVRGRGSTPVVNKIASLNYEPATSTNTEKPKDNDKLENKDLNEELIYNDDLDEKLTYIISALNEKRKRDKEATPSKRIRKSLKDNPQIINTPALRKQKENELELEPELENPKNQIMPSILSQPRIEKEKEIEKELRNKERVEVANIIENLTTGNPSPIENVNKLKSEKNIKLISGNEEYDIVKNLNNIKCDITLAQLLNAAPRIRSQLNQNLKIEKPTSKIVGSIKNINSEILLVNNIDHSYQSKRKEAEDQDIAMVDATIDGIAGKLLVDNCSNLSIMTKSYYEKLPQQYEQVGVSRGRIRLATKNDEYSEGKIVKIPVTIGSYTMTVNFRILEKEDPFYDMILNLKTQIDNKLFVHPTLYSLCRINKDGLIDVLAPINNEPLEEEKIMCVIKQVEGENNTSNTPEDIKAKLKKIEGLSPMEYIHHKDFLSTIKDEYQENILKILEENIDIIATSSEELTPSKLAPHKINLKPGAQPVKQKAYRLAKFKSDILKEILKKLIEDKLVEASYSEWSSPVVLVPKPNGRWRMCVDYRKVNDLILMKFLIVWMELKYFLQL
eukprot:jgi/Orpsp1_1/1186666/evm.model.d7180000052401.1